MAADRMVTSGRVYVWQGGSLWLGGGQGRSEWHAHHAHQVALALEGSCRFRSEADGAWTGFSGAFVPSERTHQFEFEGVVAHLFVEPETLQGRSLLRHSTSAGVSPLPEAERRRMTAMLLGATGDEQVLAGARAAVAELTGSVAGAEAADPRVLKAMDFIRTRVRAPVSLADAAAVASLSASRFRHLFVQETGTSFRAYMLWLRLNVAIETAMAGASWTSAAHEAGFADSAHLTRTFKRMFGINPANLSNSARTRAAG